jgi:hypothetical protein
LCTEPELNILSYDVRRRKARLTQNRSGRSRRQGLRLLSQGRLQNGCSREGDLPHRLRYPSVARHGSRSDGGQQLRRHLGLVAEALRRRV